MDYASAYLKETRAFGELIRNADQSTPVPTCPGWSIEQLFRHVGRGDRWAAQIVRDRMDSFLDFRSVEDGKPPPDLGDAISWLKAVPNCWSTRWNRRVWKLRCGPSSDRGQPIGGFGGGFTRMRCTEPTPRSRSVSTSHSTPTWQRTGSMISRAHCDSGRKRRRGVADRGRRHVHLHATDSGLGAVGEWTIALEQGAIAWAHEHGKGTVALRGGAGELLLAMTRRVSLVDTEIELFGDDVVWQRWLDRTPL